MDGNIASLAQGQFASPGLQYSTYPYQVPDGHGALAAYYAAYQPWGQSWSGNVLGQVGQPIGGIGGLFGNPQLGGMVGGWGGQLPNPQIALGGLTGCNAGPQQLASQGWLGNLIGQSSQPIGFGGGFGTGQYGNYATGLGSQLFGSPQGTQPIQQAAQLAQQVAQQAGQQVANQAAQQAAQQVAQAAQHVAQQVAQQAGQQVVLTAQQAGQQAAQQAALIAQQAAQQVAQQAAQQAALQAAQVAQQVAHQAAHQIVAGCLGQQAYNPGNALGFQYTTPWGAQGGYGNYFGLTQQPFGINLGGGFGYPQFGAGFGGFPYSALAQSALQGGIGMFQPGLRALNPFAGASLGAQQLAGTQRFSFA